MNYAGLPSNKYHALAKKICPKGAGTVFTFGLKGGYEAGVKLVSNVKLFSHLANIGDVRSLIIHPASTTHRQLTDEQRKAAGAGPDVVRLSIGIEDADDIIADLKQGLAGWTSSGDYPGHRRRLSPGSISRLAPTLVDGWIPGTSPGMTAGCRLS